MSFVYNKTLKKRSKQKDVYAHLIKRIIQRFGFIPSKDDIQQVIKQIKNNKSQFLGFQSRNRSAHIVTMNNRKMVVIYNREKKYLHTAFPVSWLNKESEKLRASTRCSYSGLEYTL